MRKFAFLLAVVFLLAGLGTYAHARKLHRKPEAFYQTQWCAEHGGQSEFVLSDGTRCDCITDTNSIEFDFAPKWAEAIGQALYYGAMTRKEPGIVLIVSGPNDEKYVRRIETVAEEYRIKIAVWTMNE